MRNSLRILALVLAVATVALWFGLGANRGWTRTTVPVKTVDDVTGIEGIEYQKRFQPGVEALAIALAVSALLAGTSLVFRNNKQREITE